jgi:hypothetical protein
MSIAASRRVGAALQLFATLLLPVILAIVFLLRAELIEAAAGSYTGCQGCFRLPTLGQDAWIFAAVLALLSLACAARHVWIRLAARVAAVALVLFSAVDLVLFDLLSQRLHLDDIVRFSGDVRANWSVVRASLASTQGMLKGVSAIGLLLLLPLACLPTPRRVRVATVFAVLAASTVGFALFARTVPVRYVHTVLTENVIETNLPLGRMKPYGADFIEQQRLLASGLPQRCEQHAATTHPDVIVLLVESLSAWHSGLLGGPRDWTPRLDAIAQQNHYLTNFYANGFTTSAGEIALATGRVPFNPPGVIEFNFDNYAIREDSLPDVARRAGYEASFFTPGNTGFLGLGEWLRWLGFDARHNSEDAFYEGHRRWQFDAVEDRVFYDRFLQWLDQRPKQRPFVSILLTVTSHPPFLDPNSAEINPESTMRYVDEQIGRLYDELRERSFFDNGILLVLGDHRTMTPLYKEEYRAYGDRAFARIPLVVAGAVDMPAIVSDSFQQTDLLPSLSWAFGERHCRDPFAGNFLRPDPQPAAYITHIRGDDRNRVDIYHGATAVSGYHLNGDASHWLDAPPSDAERIAAWINVQRADAAQRRIEKEAQTHKTD